MSAFYCLQPLVVRKLKDGRFEVVDGQQRLTSLFILLSHRRDLLAALGKKLFSIDFETRDPAFLAEIDLDRSDENVDFHHICEARRAVDDWMNGRDPMHALKLLQHLLNDDVAGRNVKFIWYELAPGDDPVAAFTRLNVGEIPLTEAELIRALFLRRAAQEDETGNLPLRIACEWDQIEQRLQNDAIWYFLQNGDAADVNRIGLVFRLVAQMSGQVPAPMNITCSPTLRKRSLPSRAPNPNGGKSGRALSEQMHQLVRSRVSRALPCPAGRNQPARSATSTPRPR